MKRYILLIVILIGAQMAWAQDESRRVLFIGNSYTEVNNLPLLVKNAAESVGDRIEYESNTPGGCTFQQHCINQSMDMICQGGWDVVVLQEQSQLPSFPQFQVEAECFPYAHQLIDSVYANNENGEAMLYMTWGRENGDPQNATVFPPLATYEGMDSLLYERYMYMGRTYDASICPVGRVWRYLRTNNRDIQLYANDGSHPSLEGSYAAACAFYTLIFRKSPQLISFNPGIDEENARAIREAVQTVVFDTLCFWLRQCPIDTTQTDTIQTDTTQTDTTQVDTVASGINFQFPEHKTQITVYPNPATTEATIVVDGPAHCFDAVLYDMNGRRLRACKLNQPTSVIDMNDLAPGIYLLSILSRTDTRTIRLVKQ
jgi:hypothetical protein